MQCECIFHYVRSIINIIVRMIVIAVVLFKQYVYIP